MVNVQANFNEVIRLSFHGDIKKAIVQADYQWLMFYPCLYFFAIWDAWKDAGGGKDRYSFLLCVIPGIIVGLFLKIFIKGQYGPKSTKVNQGELWKVL